MTGTKMIWPILFSNDTYTIEVVDVASSTQSTVTTDSPEIELLAYRVTNTVTNVIECETLSLSEAIAAVEIGSQAMEALKHHNSSPPQVATIHTMKKQPTEH